MCLQTRCTLVVVAAFFLNLLHKIGSSAISEVLVQVPVGETVTLMCRSNDENHNFFYWYLNEKNIIVGPSNTYDIGKFKYEVLSGNLTIKAVSKNEEGVYNCVSRGVADDDVNIRSVRMVVQGDWEEVYENDPYCVIAIHDMTDEKVLCSKYEVLLYKNGLKPALIRKSKTKTKSRKSNDETKADNALEYENDNLKRIINLMEVKNRVLEENCNLLKEKNFYFESRLKQIEMESDASEKEGRLEKDTEEEESDESQKSKSLKDRISGVLFGVALPKLPHILGKIKEKKNEIKSFIEEHGHEGVDCPMQNGAAHCPLQNGKFKETMAAVKVNLFRVVVVLGTLMVLSGVGYAGYRIWKNRYRHPSYLVPSEDDEEDSGDELFRAPGTSRGAQNPLISNSTESFETPGISTDFRSILDTANNK